MDENAQMKTFSIKIEKENEIRFNKIHEALDNNVKGQTFATLLDRFEKPLQVADRTKALEEELAAARAEAERLQEQCRALMGERDDLQQLCESTRQELASAHNEQLQTAEALQTERPARASEQRKENEVRLVILPDNLKALDYVAARESKRRNQMWSRSHVVNHFIFSRFVKGELNGDLNSIPDSDVRKMGIATRPQKPATTPTQEKGKEEITL